MHDELSAATGTDDCWRRASSSESKHSHRNAKPSVPDDINDSAMKHFAWISESAPQFAINGTDVHIITEPSDFYETLKVCFFAC